MQTPYDVSRACVAVLCASLLTSCGKDAPPPPSRDAAPPGVLITATQVQLRRFEVLEEVVGSLENVMDPKLGAEVAGKVIRVLGFAGKK